MATPRALVIGARLEEVDLVLAAVAQRVPVRGAAAARARAGGALARSGARRGARRPRLARAARALRSRTLLAPVLLLFFFFSVAPPLPPLRGLRLRRCRQCMRQLCPQYDSCLCAGGRAPIPMQQCLHKA